VKNRAIPDYCILLNYKDIKNLNKLTEKERKRVDAKKIELN